MFNKYDKDYPEFAKYMNKRISEDKLSHAFLVECRNIENYRDVILEFVKKILDQNKYESGLDIDRLVSNYSYPELKIIEPINRIIRKEQLLDLQKEFSIKPIYGKYLVYIIDGAEFLNKSSANTILKFLEEPPENIIAILLTNNIYNVIRTISSRCQCLVLSHTVCKKSFSQEVIDLASTIDRYGENALGYIDTNWYFLDKESLIEKFKELESYYIYLFNENRSAIESSRQSTLKKISKKIIIIDDCLKKLRYNVNIKLLFDQFVLAMSEVI